MPPRRSLPRGEARAVAAFFGLVFVVFTCVFPYNAGLNNPNENVRIYMTMAIVEDHGFAIDKVVERYGWVNDMALKPDRAGVPHRYSIKGPATGYFGVPFYWAFTKLAPRFGHPMPTAQSKQEDKIWWFRATTCVLRLFVVELPCFAFLVWLERWLRRMTVDDGKSDVVLRLTAVAAVALGTNYLAYSLMFVSHALFAVAAFGSFGIITRERMLFADARRRRAGMAFLAGLLAGLASLLEYHAFPISCCLALYALTTFWRPTRLLLFGLGATLVALALMFYQWRCYGNPLTPGHKFAETAAFADYHKQGFYGLVAPSFEVFKDLSLSHAFGFFGMSPFMWLGLGVIVFGVVFGFGTRRARSIRRQAHLVWLAMMLILWVAISSAVNWRGGWTVGPRFFGCAPPFFAFGALCALEQIARKGPAWRALARSIAGGLAVASVLEIGFVSLHFNSVPEEVTRPLAQVSLPLARAGFVPHHVGELFGVMSPAVWWGICGCMFAAAMLAALLWSRDKWWTYATRVLLVPLVFFVGVRPAFGEPSPEEHGDGGLGSRMGGARDWEPKNRDRIATLREQAERYGQRRPCNWYKLADVERIVSWTAQAEKDEQKAGVPRSECK